MTDKISIFIFNQWKAEFKNKKKSRAFVSENFSDLFQNLSLQNVPFDEAHSILQKAIIVHWPKPDVIKRVYKNITGITKSESEFGEAWKENISDAATSCFHEFYSIEEAYPPKAIDKISYGSMSKEEYMKQRKYADSHPTIDIDSISHELIELEDEIYQQIADAGFKIEPGDIK